MHHHYQDILDRIDELPSWFDEQGVPRYGAFTPDKLGNIHAREAALAEVSCQECGRLFNVAMDGRHAGRGRSLCDEIRLGRLHYGDPPNMRCCAGGPTMNSVMHGVLEYWSLDLERSYGWERDPAYEGLVTEAHEPADTVSEVIAAIDSGQEVLCVDCTSTTHRYDVTARVTAALAQEKRVLVACAPRLAAVAGGMLKGLGPGNTIGHVQRPAAITVVPFDRLSEAKFTAFDAIVILTGAFPLKAQVPRAKDEQERLWSETVDRLAAAAAGKLLIEFRLAGRRRIIERPGVIIDGWRKRLSIA